MTGDPDCERVAYEDIGRVVAAWGAIDQLLARQIWLARDPQRKSSFRTGAMKPHFGARWNEWSEMHKSAFATHAERQALTERVAALGAVRHDLCHNLIVVAGVGPNTYTLGIYRISSDWRGRFDTWAVKHARPPKGLADKHFLSWARRRKPAPADTESLHYDKRDLNSCRSGCESVLEEMVRISETLIAKVAP